MRRRPVCILCMLLVVFLCVTDWLGFSLIRGNPLPQSVQTWIRKHPESTICGEVVRCRENEDFQSVYLRNTYLIYNSEKVSIDNIKVYLKQKKNHSGNSDVDKLLAGSLVLVSGKLEEVQSPTNPGEFDSKAYYGCQRIYYVMKKGDTFCIYNNQKHDTDEITDAKKESQNSKEIKKLTKQINKRYEQALKQDKKLKQFFEGN